MISMTGYGQGSYSSDQYSVVCEIKSYNNRYLDIVTSLNSHLSCYESLIKEKVSNVSKRGHVEVSLKLKTFDINKTVNLDTPLLKAYEKAFNEASALINVGKATISDYIALDDVFTLENSDDSEKFTFGVEIALEEALTVLKENKIREGEGTKKDLERLRNHFLFSLEEIEKNNETLEEHFSSLLFSKFEELMGEKKDDPRLRAEVATLIVKYSINEEIKRLRIHIEEFDRLINLNESVGKRLDFLCQEMNRECNTIASKSQLARINLLVVNMKDDIENIREQIRNIE